MLLYSRQVTLTGSPRKTMPWAMDITAYVNAHSPLDVSLWSATFGVPIGSLAWSAAVESQEQLATATAGLIADEGYLDRIDAAADFVTAPGQDTLQDLIYGTATEPEAVGAVAQVTTALAVVDEMAAAVGFAVEIAQHIEGVIGSPIMVLTGLYGPMGAISWIGVSPDMAAADNARAKMLTDETYLSRVAKTKGLFIPGSGTVVQAVRIA